MDAVEIILYVVIMIVWVIIQNSRKKKLKAQREEQSRRAQEDYEQLDDEMVDPRPNQRSMVEEIIEELRNENSPKEVDAIPEKEYAPTVVKDFSEKVNPVNSDYEKRLSELKSKKKGKDSIRFDNYKIDTNYESDEDEEDDDVENEYASLIFEDSDSPRKAIILSEILNRKHF